jgi:hypothetical protein
VSGDNTLYTVPTGKTAVSALRTFINGTQGLIITGYNVSGARTLKMYLVPSGDSPSAANIINDSFAWSNNSALGFSQSFGALPSGYSVVINSDSSTAGQYVWLTMVAEVPQ